MEWFIFAILPWFMSPISHPQNTGLGLTSPSYPELTQGLVQLNDRSFSYFPWWHQHDPRLMMLLITVIIVIRNNNSSENDVMKLSVHCQCYLLISRFTDRPSRETWDSQDAGSRFESEDNCFEPSIITSWYKNARQLSPTKIFLITSKLTSKLANKLIDKTNIWGYF